MGQTHVAVLKDLKEKTVFIVSGISLCLLDNSHIPSLG